MVPQFQPKLSPALEHLMSRPRYLLRPEVNEECESESERAFYSSSLFQSSILGVLDARDAPVGRPVLEVVQDLVVELPVVPRL
jgi:hypothetical protein